MDKYPSIGKCLAVGIILLFVGTAIISSGAQDIEKSSLPTSSGYWLYVGGSGPGNYTKIQDAIDNASNGDTIFVYSGIYYENTVVNSSINIIGENRDNTIIESKNKSPRNDTLSIYANYVNISGFTFQNSPRCGIFLGSRHVIITNNIFLNNSHGIHFYYLSKDYVYISNNIFSNNFCGIYLVQSKNNTISENNIINNDFGIRIDDSVNNTILNNNIQSNIQYGILLSVTSNGNHIYKNNFINNTKSAYFRLLCHQNKWDGNFWDEPRDTPVIIYGSIGLVFIPWINIDWHPAKEPYDITEMT
jgi:parallel beta-helix repeat protein